MLYGLAVLALTAVAPGLGTLGGGVGVFPHLVAAVFVTVFIYAFFGLVVLPWAGGAARDRADVVTRQWALSSFVFGTTLAFVVPGLLTLVA